MNKKRLVLSVILIFSAVFISGTVLGKQNDNIDFNYSNLKSGITIQEFYSDKARYNPKENVEFTVKIKNTTKKKINGKLALQLKHFDEDIASNRKKVKIKANGSKKVKLNWQASQEDYKGYTAEVWFISESNNLLDMSAIGVDVSSDWTKFPRYGYLSDFGRMKKEEMKEIIANLNKYHINGLQFYDWQFRHEKPLAGTVDDPKKKWVDVAYRMNYRKTVESYIKYAHQHNMAAMNYNLLYAASSDYQKYGVKKKWGYFKDKQGSNQDYHSMGSSWAVSRLYLMNPGNEEWQNYIFSREKEVFKVFNFDGWHVDQLGDRGVRYDYKGNKIDNPKAFKDFLAGAKESLNKDIVFNAVGEFGQREVASAGDVDFLYAEVWGGHEEYEDLKEAIDNGLKYTNGEKNTVLAAYMNYNKRAGLFNTPGVLLTDAVIFASGGGHIELGDTGMLSNEYFPYDSLVMSSTLKDKIREYYDFMVMYQNLLRGDNVKEIDRTVTAGNEKLSPHAKGDNIWYFVKEKGNKEMLHLINLLGNDNLWRDGKGTKTKPPLKEDITLKYYTFADINKIKVASPDFREGTVQSLNFTEGVDSGGRYIKFEIPKLKYWDMIVFNK